MMLKVGDKVVNVQENSTRDGEVGTIIAVDGLGGSQPYLVEYENSIPLGHSGNGHTEIRGKEGHCWWEEEYELQKIDDTQQYTTMLDIESEEVREDTVLEIICKELGVTVGEEWTGNDGHEYMITDFGQIKKWNDENEEWIEAFYNLGHLVAKELKPVWKPKEREEYWVPDIYSDSLCTTFGWVESEVDKLWQKRKIIFKTKEEATSCAEKMLDVIKEG